MGIQPGGAICVLEGTSTGACRRIVSGLSPTTECNAVSYGSSLCVFFLPHQSFFNHSSLILSAAQTTVNHGLCPETHFSFDRPFPSPLDGTSLVSIMPFVGHMAFNGNDYSDGEPPQSVAVSTLSWTPFAQLIAASSPAVNARQSEVPLSHLLVTQSESDAHAAPSPHRWLQVGKYSSTPPLSSASPRRTSSPEQVGSRRGPGRTKARSGIRT